MEQHGEGRDRQTAGRTNNSSLKPGSRRRGSPTENSNDTMDVKQEEQFD
jgi:hypothetical protein